MPHILQYGLMHLEVAIDNGLLMGMFLPPMPAREKIKIAWIVAITLSILQGFAIMLMEGLLQYPIVLMAVVIFIVWVSIQTLLEMVKLDRVYNKWSLIGKVLFFTLIGNTDDVLWLAGRVDGQYPLMFAYFVLTLPLLHYASLYLADLTDRHRWIYFFAAALAAWIGSDFFLKTSGGIYMSGMIAPLVIQILFTSLVLGMGLAIIRLQKYSGTQK